MRIAGLIVLLLPFQPASLVAQQTAPHESATLAGIVTHITGARIPEVVAELRSEAAPAKVLRTVTDSLGIYDFSALSAGEYELQLSRPGFSPLTIRSIRIAAGEQRELPALQLTTTFCGDDQAVVEYAHLLRLGDYAGSLIGRVTLDQRPLLDDSLPVSDADVTLLCSSGKVCGTTTSGPDGEFMFWDLPAGIYSIRIERAGYYSIKKPGYMVRAGLESIYRSVFIERCPGGTCSGPQPTKRLPGLCQ